jgi:ribonuclease HI
VIERAILKKMTGNKEPVVEIYTDGACSGNPGMGGYGAVLRSGNNRKEISGYEADTTNNRMEMTAVIQALRQLKKPCRVKLFSDSSYVIKGMTEWLPGWIKKNWMSAQKKPVLNRDLWEMLLMPAIPIKTSGYAIEGQQSP